MKRIEVASSPSLAATLRENLRGPMLTREPLPDGVRLRDRDSVLTLTRPARNVELLRAEGFAHSGFADAILEQRETILEECGTILLFDDLSLVRGYHSDVRARLTQWSRAHRESIRAFHILTGSKLVMMGVTLANLALGGHITPHTKKETFERALKSGLQYAPR